MYGDERGRYRSDLPDLVDFALVDTKALTSQVLVLDTNVLTHRSDPFFTAALDTRPIKVSNLDSTLLVRADNFAANGAVL